MALETRSKTEFSWPHAIGLLAAAMRTPGQRASRVVIGGVDVTDLDPTLPFKVDFSVDPRGTLRQKLQALERTQGAMQALGAHFPHVWFEVESSIDEGRFVLWATPIIHPAFFVPESAQ